MRHTYLPLPSRSCFQDSPNSPPSVLLCLDRVHHILYLIDIGSLTNPWVDGGYKPLELAPLKKELFNRLANNLWSYQYQPLLICLSPTTCLVVCELTLNIWSRVFGLRSFIEADWYFSQSWNIQKPDWLRNLISLEKSCSQQTLFCPRKEFLLLPPPTLPISSLKVSIKRHYWFFCDAVSGKDIDVLGNDICIDIVTILPWLSPLFSGSIRVKMLKSSTQAAVVLSKLRLKIINKDNNNRNNY